MTLSATWRCGNVSSGYEPSTELYTQHEHHDRTGHKRAQLFSVLTLSTVGKVSNESRHGDARVNPQRDGITRPVQSDS